MSTSGWPITPLLICLISSATSSPVSTSTSAPPLLLQISPPSPPPETLPSLPSPSLLTPNPPVGEPGKVSCPLKMSPSALVVRFGDPVTLNCSVQKFGYSLLGWINGTDQQATKLTMEHYLVWTVDRMTEWSFKPMCFALSDQGGQCDIKLPLTVFKPPDNVTFSFVNHTGPMLAAHRYTLDCTVNDVAPVENLIVTFHRGDEELGRRQLQNNTEKEPVTESFTINFTPSRVDDGAEFWCEARLELGPEGPQQPPVVRSQKITASVLYGPQITCPTKLRVKEGERFGCEVRGNPQPSVNWFRDGQIVALPDHTSRKHSGYYTISANGLDGHRNFTVEVEVLTGGGNSNSCKKHFLLAAFVIQMINWL